MGTTYAGAYAEEIGYHEGYAAAIINGVKAPEIWEAYEGQDGYLTAACDCGNGKTWHGDSRYPITDAGADQALAEWQQEHLQPLIDQAAADWPRWAKLTGERAARAAEAIAAGKYDQAAELLAILRDDTRYRQRMATELADQHRSTPSL